MTMEPPAVPEELFQHVEKSLDNGIKKDMLFEILHEDDTSKFWIAKVDVVCEHMVYCRYLGGTVQFLCDFANATIHSLGWYSGTDKSLQPPREVKNTPAGDLAILLRTAVEECESVPEESLLTKGLRSIVKIIPGMKLELQNEKNPFKFWVATVIENAGGRLLLRYDAPDDIVNDLWIFYTDPRIYPIGYVASQGSPYVLEFPKNEDYLKYEENVWNAQLNAAIESDKKIQYPHSLLPKLSKRIQHNLKIGMKIEAINPKNMLEICPATITKIFDKYHFLVTVDETDMKNEEEAHSWLCNCSSPYIFPVGWADSNNIKISQPSSYRKNFDWKVYLNSTNSNPAPDYMFSKITDAISLGFQIGTKLEAADPLNPSNIYTATIINIVKHLLLVKFEDSNKTYWFHYESTNIFPIGWCASNNVILQEPKEEIHTQKKILEKSHLSAQIKEQWCDKIYFNYKCYSGPLVSKNKLAKLPKYVGPGPLSLVIREVMNMVISVAYKPAKLLKDWEYEGKPTSNIKLEMLKAKLKANTHRANVQVVSKYEEVPEFCKEICSKLQACPNLFGLIEVVDECPEKCNASNKTKFLRKKRRKRGLHFMTIRARERRAALEAEKDGAESANESEPSAPLSPRNSESGTRAESPDSSSDAPCKKQAKKRVTRSNVPPLEMKTRGAKLPNFALQIKEGHWNRKDVETIYNNTCVVPRKQYSDDSDSDDNTNSCNSLETKNNGDIEKIFDVSDSEEPELKKLRVTPLYETIAVDNKNFGFSDSSNSTNSLTNGNIDLPLPYDPSCWSVQDLYLYLIKYGNSDEVAGKLRDEEVDGAAFLMLNWQTVREHLKVTEEPAMMLCKHISLLKWSYYCNKYNLRQ